MRIHSTLVPVLALVLLFAPSCALAPETASVPPPRARADEPLPVREVTCFKDGHAFVLREGAVGVEARGEIVLERLPQPVLGTFWPFASGGAHVVSARAAKERVIRPRTALDLRQLIDANRGARVTLYDVGDEQVEGVLAGFTSRSGEEVERADPTGGSPRAGEKGSVVLVRTSGGMRALPIERVRDVTFHDKDATVFEEEVLADRLTLRVDVGDGGAAGVHIGVVYVQQGLRWIPSYKVDIDGAGRASIEMQATLVNDLIDLERAKVHLVVGVPRFAFAGHVDPIALQETAVDVGRRIGAGSALSNAMSNALRTQVAGNFVAEADAGAPPSPTLESSGANEDLFVFTLADVTLRKGERIVVPVTKFSLAYTDVYTLDVEIAPPLAFQAALGGEQSTQLARLLLAPSAKHALRVTNDSTAPLTTAPALISSGGSVLAQGLLTYTPVGARTDLPMTEAIELRVETDEREVDRKQDAFRWNGDPYARVDMRGSITLTNSKREAVEVEVRRLVLGLADGASHGGTFEQKGLIELWSGPDRPEWLSWWSWPYWWHRWNGIAKFKWNVRLEPGQRVELESTWHYFWR